MATDSIMGLFQTPEQYQLAQQQAQMEQARQYAAQDPMQRAVASQYFAGGQLGRALGSPDPLLQRQAQRNALIQQVNMADPASLRQAIQASSGDPELSSYLLSKYKELTGIQKEQSVIEKNQAWEAAKTDSEKKRNLLSKVEQDLADGKAVDPSELNRARLAWAQETKPKMFNDPTTGTIQTVPGVDVNLFPNLGKTLIGSSTGAAGARTAGVIETSASIEAKTKDVQAADATVKSLDNSLATLGELQKLRENKDWTTNPWVADTMSKFPTQARTQSNLVKSQIADKVIGVIGEMKQQSKTGATGFGALNMAELDKLESTVRRLDPLDPNFDKDIQYVIDKITESKKLITTELDRRKQKLSSATGNPDVAPKQSSMAGKNPQLQPKRQFTFEEIVAHTSKDPVNKGRTKQEIEAAVREWMTKNPDQVKQ